MDQCPQAQLYIKIPGHLERGPEFITLNTPYYT